MYCHMCIVNYTYCIDLSLWSHIFLYSAFSLIFMFKWWVCLNFWFVILCLSFIFPQHAYTLVCYHMLDFHFLLTYLNFCFLSHAWVPFSSNMPKLLFSVTCLIFFFLQYAWIFVFHHILNSWVPFAC